MYSIPIIRSTAPKIISDWIIGYVYLFDSFIKGCALSKYFVAKSSRTKTALNMIESLYLVRPYLKQSLCFNESEKVGIVSEYS